MAIQKQYRSNTFSTSAVDASDGSLNKNTPFESVMLGFYIFMIKLSYRLNNQVGYPNELIQLEFQIFVIGSHDISFIVFKFLFEFMSSKWDKWRYYP